VQQKTGAVNGSGNKNQQSCTVLMRKGKMVPSRVLSGGHSESCRGKQKHAEHLSLGQHQVGTKSQLHAILCKGKNRTWVLELDEKTWNGPVAEKSEQDLVVAETQMRGRLSSYRIAQPE
jgi:hypothetical protein